MAQQVRAKYTAKYPLGVCQAIRNIAGDAEFARLFGSTDPNTALQACVQSGANNAEAYIGKWLTVWPSKMAAVFRLT
jgi:hypothetical protein